MTNDIPEIDPDFAAKRKAALLAFLEGDGVGDFDMYAVDPGAWAHLSQMIPGLIVTSAGGFVPFQAEGTIHGHPFYFRYRHGGASLSVGEHNSSTMPYGSGSLYSAYSDYGDEYGGSLSGFEFEALMLKLVPMLEPSSFWWNFEGLKVKIETNDEGELFAEQTDKVERYSAWGNTAAEAFERVGEPSDYLLAHGYSLELQAEMHRLAEVKPEPTNSDDRVWPEVKPNFTVKDEIV